MARCGDPPFARCLEILRLQLLVKSFLRDREVQSIPPDARETSHPITDVPCTQSECKREHRRSRPRRLAQISYQPLSFGETAGSNSFWTQIQRTFDCGITSKGIASGFRANGDTGFVSTTPRGRLSRSRHVYAHLDTGPTGRQTQADEGSWGAPGTNMLPPCRSAQRWAHAESLHERYVPLHIFATHGWD